MRPADWVTESVFPDPTEVKPAGWDDIPEKIPDPDAYVSRSAWLLLLVGDACACVLCLMCVGGPVRSCFVRTQCVPRRNQWPIAPHC